MKVLRSYIQCARSPGRREHGQALVEFALVLPILLLLAVGIMDFGRALFVYSEVSNATREAVRYGTNTDMINPDPDLTLKCTDIENRARSMFTLAPTTLTPTVLIERPNPLNPTLFDHLDCATTKVEPGDRVRVEVQATVELITLQMIGPLFGRNGPLSLPITFVASRSLLPAGGIATGPTIPSEFSDDPAGTQAVQTAAAGAATAAASAAAATSTAVAATATAVAETATSSAATLAALGSEEQTATIAARESATAVAQQTATADVATAIAHQTLLAAEAAETAAAMTETAVAATATAAAFPAPANFTAVPACLKNKNNSVTFSWNAVPGAANYHIYRLPGSTLVGTVLGSITNVTVNSVIDNNTSLSFYVVAVNSVGREGPASNVSVATCGTVATNTLSATSTKTNTPTNTPTPSLTPTPSQTPTPSNTPTDTPTPSQTPTPNNTSTPSQTPTPSNTPTPSQTPTPSLTPTPLPTLKIEFPTDYPAQNTVGQRELYVKVKVSDDKGTPVSNAIVLVNNDPNMNLTYQVSGQFYGENGTCWIQNSGGSVATIQIYASAPGFANTNTPSVSVIQIKSNSCPP